MVIIWLSVLVVGLLLVLDFLVVVILPLVFHSIVVVLVHVCALVWVVVLLVCRWWWWWFSNLLRIVFILLGNYSFQVIFRKIGLHRCGLWFARLAFVVIGAE